jgi:hypothetical protein
MKATLSGGASGGAASQSRTRIDSVPKVTDDPTGASIWDTFAATLSRPWRTTIGSGIIAACAGMAKTAASAVAAVSVLLIYGKG